MVYTFNGRISSNAVDLKNKVLVFSQTVHDLMENGFYTMDGQANVWVASADIPGYRSLENSLLPVILQAEHTMNADLAKLVTLAPTPSIRREVLQTQQASVPYEQYFKKALTEVSQGEKAVAVANIFVNNSSASNVFTNDLLALQHATTRLMASSAESTVASAKLTGLISLLSAIVIILFNLFFVWYFRRTVAPIPVISRQLTRIAQGNLTDERILVNRADEIGILAKAMNEMKDQLKQLLGNVKEAAEQVASASQQLMASAEETMKTMGQISVSIQEVSGGAARQMAETNEGVVAVENIVAQAQQVANTVGAVAASSMATTQKAVEGNHSINEAVSQMHTINEAVGSTSKSLHQLNDHSQEVGKIIETISAIAEQTNLLALNAAIEAARAGEQGKGFAVVAEEVRKLAEGSATSAREITKIIQAIQAMTTESVISMARVSIEATNGTKVIEKSGESFSSISSAADQVSQQLVEVSTATQKIANAAQHVKTKIDKMKIISEATDHESQSIAAGTEEQLASVEEITASASALSKQAQILRDLLTQFTL